MNNFREAFKIVVEKHLSEKDEDVEPSSLHPLTLIDMIKRGQKNENTSLQKYSKSPLEKQQLN
jgi:D-lyxose ketol-isomerase